MHLKGFFLFVLASCFSACFSECCSPLSPHFNLERTKKRSLPTATKRFLNEHGCFMNAASNVINDLEGFARSTTVFYTCPRLQDSVIPVVLCHRYCVDVHSCRNMTAYKNTPVTMGLRLRKNTQFVTVQVPVACQCLEIRPTVPVFNATACDGY